MALPAYIDEGTGEITDGEAWVGLGSTTLSSDTAVVTFASPNDGSSTDWGQFMDLFLISYARSAASANDRQLNVQLNNDTASSPGNYDSQNVRSYAVGVGSGVTNDGPRFEIGQISAGSNLTNMFASVYTHFFDINSGKYKSGISRSGQDRNGGGWCGIWGLTWNSQAPITEIDIYDLYGSNILTGSRFDLFGILPRMVS
tara:strand:+ start:297 stop:896 length:600 start_codon:yes stop_codon:yes gene_type:complete